MTSLLSRERKRFHKSICKDLLFFKPAKNGPVASNADKDQRASREIAEMIAIKLGASNSGTIAGQTSGNLFEQKVCAFVEDTFPNLNLLRPGNWQIEQITGRGGEHLSRYDQYHHLSHLSESARNDRQLLASLGNDYTISPDVVVMRCPEPDKNINFEQKIVGGREALYSSIRKETARGSQLHASISCKWTMRSDRAQNTRSEALNLLRNRKGRAPHIVAVVAEPTPSRIASLALGTGDIDCVYHFALPELIEAVKEFGEDEALSLLEIMVDGRRLKDITDLPLDLCV